MRKRSIYVFVSTALAMLIPSPGRFVYGLVLVLELNFLMLFGLLANSLIKKMKLEEETSVILLATTIFSTIFFRQLLILINAELALTLGFNLFLLPCSFFFLGYLLHQTKDPLSQRISFTFSHILTFSVYALLYFLIRDILGYGTFTYLNTSFQIVEKVLFDENSVIVFSILASIPGSLLMSSIVLFVHITIRKNINIVRNVEACK